MQNTDSSVIKIYPDSSAGVVESISDRVKRLRIIAQYLNTELEKIEEWLSRGDTDCMTECSPLYQISRELSRLN
ncbi:MAG: hypothetical protein GYA18_09470 [Chloroflexi bacterium]|nr:hypothetical protein [Chloroflexota bacterium]